VHYYVERLFRSILYCGDKDNTYVSHVMFMHTYCLHIMCMDVWPIHTYVVITRLCTTLVRRMNDLNAIIQVMTKIMLLVVNDKDVDNDCLTIPHGN